MVLCGAEAACPDLQLKWSCETFPTYFEQPAAKNPVRTYLGLQRYNAGG